MLKLKKMTGKLSKKNQFFNKKLTQKRRAIYIRPGAELLLELANNICDNKSCMTYQHLLNCRNSL